MNTHRMVTINVGDTNDTATVYQRIAEERERQRRMWQGSWGDVRANAVYYPFRAYAVLGEEFGEVGRSLIEGAELSVVAFELTQVAAVSVAWLNAIEDAAAGAPWPTTPHPQGS